MVVYVDDQLRAQTRKRPGGRVFDARWSQLLADSTVELLTFASQLRIPPARMQRAGTPAEHFEVTADQRQQALHSGAVAVITAERVRLVAAKQAGLRFDLDVDRGNPDWYAELTPPAAVSVTCGGRRVQLRRAAGFTLAPGTIAVVPPSRWASPYRPAGRTRAAYAAAAIRFAEYLARNPALVDLAAGELHGHDLACWCPLHVPCHADVWLTVLA